MWIAALELGVLFLTPIPASPLQNQMANKVAKPIPYGLDLKEDPMHKGARSSMRSIEVG
jgi:hypothetical protein